MIQAIKVSIELPRRRTTMRLGAVTRRRAIDKHCKTVFEYCSPALPSRPHPPSRNACCPVHASNHATARTSSPPNPTLGRLAAVTCVSLPRGLVALACSFRMVGLIVDVSPCAPVTKEAEGCSTPTRWTTTRKRQGSESKMREKERNRKRKKEGMHTSRFPRAARCKRRASRAYLYVSLKGTGLVRGCPRQG